MSRASEIRQQIKEQVRLQQQEIQQSILKQKAEQRQKLLDSMTEAELEEYDRRQSRGGCGNCGM